MDTLKISTFIGKKLASSILSKVLSKKAGFKVDVWLDSLDISLDEEDAHIKFSGSARVPADKLVDI